VFDRQIRDLERLRQGRDAPDYYHDATDQATIGACSRRSVRRSWARARARADPDMV
jgi:hypothetical protein